MGGFMKISLGKVTANGSKPKFIASLLAILIFALTAPVLAQGPWQVQMRGQGYSTSQRQALSQTPGLRPLSTMAASSQAVSDGGGNGAVLSSTSWTTIGPAALNTHNAHSPESGRATGVAAHPTDPNILYLATSGGGVWKTTNAGASWTP